MPAQIESSAKEALMQHLPPSRALKKAEGKFSLQSKGIGGHLVFKTLFQGFLARDVLKLRTS
jgi:hypothetical protein